MKLIRLAAVCLGLTAIGCAVTLPPPGGPADKTSPSVTGSDPADSSAGIPSDSPISITFSEGMKRTKFERNVTFSPPVSIGKVNWKKNTITIEPEEPLHPDTTYLVEIKPGFKDIHGVTNARGYTFVFATSAVIDSGTISGFIYFRRKPSSKGIARLFVLPKDSSFAPEASKPDREVSTDDSGRYVFHYLPTDDSRFVVWAFHDQSGNKRHEPKKEFGAVFPDTLVLSIGSPALGDRDITIVDPTEPASVNGRVVNRTAIDSLTATVAAYSANDSTPLASLTRCDVEGRYKLPNLLAGSYIIKAFFDLAADSLCGRYPCPKDTASGCLEPYVLYPDTVTVSPGAEIKLEDLILE